MDDLGLSAALDEHTTISVSPIEHETYANYIEDDSLGGGEGYFLIRQSKRQDRSKFEILAKAPSFEAASQIFDMIVLGHRNRVTS